MSALCAGATWWLSATLAWLALLSPEVLPGEAAALLERAWYALGLSAATAVVGSLPLLVLHGARMWRDRRGSSGAVGSLALACLALLYPAWDLADFLTSGDSIAQSSLWWPARLGLFAGAVVGGGCLWAFHLVIVGAARWRRGDPMRWVQWSLFALGCAGLLSLYHVLSGELRAYHHLARSLMLVAWFVAGTLAYGLLRRLPPRACAIAASVVAVFSVTAWPFTLTAPTGPAAAGAPLGMLETVQTERNRLLREAELVALTDLLVHTRDTSAASYDLSFTRRADCPRPQPAQPPPPLSVPSDRRRNVILISFDALRADMLSARRFRVGAARSGDKPPPLLMPQLADFAAESRHYTRAISTYPATLMAVGSALTGLSASDIMFAPRIPDNVFRRTRKRFDRQLISLPTSPWFNLPIIDALFVQDTPLARHRSAAAQSSWMITNLKRARRKGKSVFAWVHYFEPHKPYRKHARFNYGDDQRARYLSELAYVDRQFGRLARYLKRGRWFHDSLVIVFSDHGQALGERGYYGHHVYLNGWITDIPLLLRGPDVDPGPSQALVEITDVAKTVLHFADVPYAPQRLAGHSLLLPPIQNRVGIAEAFPVRGRQLFELTNQPVHNETELRARVELVQRGARNYLPKVAAVSDRHRLIVNRVTGASELYDRVQDADETRELSRTEPDRARSLSQALRVWTRRQAQRIYCAVP